VQELWQIKDRGMPVFAHTIDVTLLSLAAYPEWQERFPELNLRAITIASLLHDLNKLSTRRDAQKSHSFVMSNNPSEALVEAIDVLQAAQWQTGASLNQEEIDHIWHIVVSHHGTWGKIQPRTAEAALVHQSDYLSATTHRLTPIDANDVLPLLDQGLRWREVAARLDVTTSVVRDRLREACRAEQVADPTTLLAVWRKRGFVVTGTLERMRRRVRSSWRPATPPRASSGGWTPRRNRRSQYAPRRVLPASTLPHAS
jgi:hypothetical protein